ncbi:MAG TPA: condensation domain-containing protein, partial [Thermoanaerobaculia bacterium]|nr:condensation domain-containing protein [Thermoanaerobaculia bacterium]
FRIELGEIEAVLAGHPAVRDCVVVAREDVPGSRRLVAYVTGDGLTEADELRAFLAARLPEYMVPAFLVPLDALPLSPNGKVDRRALPAPERSREAVYAAPADAVEESLVSIWAEVLDLGQVGVDDDFFALGGHSLLAVRMASRIQEAFGVELTLRDLFRFPTIADLAPFVRETRRSQAAPSPVPGPRTGDLQLSFAQQRLWLIDQLQPGNPAYNIPLAVRLKGGIEADLLARIFTEIARRQEVLRTTFTVSGSGSPVQVIAPEPRIELPLYDLSDLPEAEREAQAGEILSREARRPFDLRRGPLLRLSLLRLAAREHVLLVTLHHIVSDAWSMGVLLREVMALYEAFSQGRPSPLPEPPVQYADFAAWQRRWLHGEVLTGQLGYWKRQLAGAPRLLELPTDRPRPALQTHHGATRPVTLPPGLSEPLRELSRREKATTFMTLLAAWAVLLGRHAGQEDVLVGTPTAGRNRREVEDLIGFFVNTLVIRADLAGAPDFGEVLRRVRQAVLDAFAHQDLPFERLVEELLAERDLSVPPLFQVLFTLQNEPWQKLQAPGLEEPLLRLSRREEATDFMTLLAAWAVLLGRHAGQEDVLVGTPIAGRNHPGIENLIGFFVNTLVIRADLSGAPSFAEVLRRVRQTALDAYSHQDLPFERLVEELVAERDLSVPPLFQVLFTLQKAPRQEIQVPGLELSVASLSSGTAKFDLALVLREG